MRKYLLIVAISIFIIFPDTWLFPQILSFESFSSGDLLTIPGVDNERKSGLEIGLEPRFSDYSYVDADNEFHFTTLINFKFPGFSFGLRVPLQWSWNSSFAQFLSNPAVANRDGIDDLRSFLRFTLLSGKVYKVGVGMIYSSTKSPVYWGEEAKKRREISLLFLSQFQYRRLSFLFDLMFTDFDKRERVCGKAYSQNYFFDQGLGMRLDLNSKISFLMELLAQNSLPKYLSNSEKINVQRWFTINGGLRVKIIDSMVLRTGITISFRNRIKLTGSSEENTFDLAREIINVEWRIKN